MEKDIIYEEKIFPKVEMWMYNICIVFISLVMIDMLINISSNLISDGVPFFDLLIILSIIMSLPMIGLIAVIVIRHSYKEFSVKITPDSIIVNHGFDKRTISFEKIDACYLEKASFINKWVMTGGMLSPWIKKINGKWRLVYSNIIKGTPQVTLSLKDAGIYKGFTFSTKNPEEVIKIINEKINKI